VNELIEKLKKIANWDALFDDPNADLVYRDPFEAYDTGIHDGEAKLARELLPILRNIHEIPACNTPAPGIVP
jgi:hypothetical protein